MPRGGCRSTHGAVCRLLGCIWFYESVFLSVFLSTCVFVCAPWPSEADRLNDMCGKCVRSAQSLRRTVCYLKFVMGESVPSMMPPRTSSSGSGKRIDLEETQLMETQAAELEEELANFMNDEATAARPQIHDVW